MSSFKEVKAEYYDCDYVQKIIDKVGPDVITIFKKIKNELGGTLPESFMYGIVCGYLHGKNFTWEESFIGMKRFIEVAQQIGKTSQFNGDIIIEGKLDGSVGIETKDKQRKKIE